jgi:hypothetical protein
VSASLQSNSTAAGSSNHSLTLTRTTMAPCQHTPPDVVARIDQLLDTGDDAVVAQSLNDAGVRNWQSGPFTRGQIANVRKGRGLRSHRERRRADGYATAGELAACYNVTPTTIRYWAQHGLLERFSCGHRHRWYYRVPVGAVILKGCGGPHAKPGRIVRHRSAIRLKAEQSGEQANTWARTRGLA